MSDLIAIRAWFLAPSQFHGYEWVILFLGIAYLYAFVVRLRLFDGGPSEPRPDLRGTDATVAILTAVLLAIIAVARVTM